MLAPTAIKKYQSGNAYWYVKREGATVSERRWIGMYPRGAKDTIYATPEIAHEHWKARVAKYDAQTKLGGERAAPGPIRAPKAKRGKPLGVTELARLAVRWGQGHPWRATDFVTVERAFSVPLRLRLPASFRAFAVRVGATEGDGLRVLSPREMIRDTKKLVRVPRSTRWETDAGMQVRIHTDHLVAFAAGGPEERWCFCVDAPGEPTVYLHHQDEPRARIRDGKGDSGWISAAVAKPDFGDFASWLRAQKP